MFQGRCGSCLFPPPCSISHVDTVRTNFSAHASLLELYTDSLVVLLQGKRSQCFQYRSRYHSRLIYDLDDGYSRGCKRVCLFPSWVQKCCKNHYGRDCQGKEDPTRGCNFPRNILKYLHFSVCRWSWKPVQWPWRLQRRHFRFRNLQMPTRIHRKGLWTLSIWLLRWQLHRYARNKQKAPNQRSAPQCKGNTWDLMNGESSVSMVTPTFC